MKNKILLCTTSALLIMAACKKDQKDTTPKDFGELKTRVIFNFTEDVGTKAYADLNNAIIKMATLAENFYLSGNEDDFVILKSSWVTARNIWEQTESFHFGPVINDDYESKMDTWPAGASDFNNLIGGGNPLEVSDIEQLDKKLRGFHAMEYLMYGTDGNKSAAALDWRQRKYLLNLAKDLKNSSINIFNQWTSGSKNFSSELIYTGNGGKTYSTKQALFMAMAGNMGDLCSRIVIDNFNKPFDAFDSTAVESPFSNRSLIDITNDIESVKSVYTGRYNGSQGYGIKDLVKDKKSSLDTKISDRITAVDAALLKITTTLDSAVIYNRVDTKTAIDAVDSLRSTIQMELLPFIKENIAD